MNILTINYEYPPLGGGGGVFAKLLAEEHVRQGHLVDYVTTRFGSQKASELIDGVRIFRVPVLGRTDVATATIRSMLTFPPVAILKALKLARNQNYDIVHTHFAIPSGPAGKYIARRLGLPHILSVYGGDVYDPSKPYSPHKTPVLFRVVKNVLRQADLVVAESKDITERTQTLYEPRNLTRIPLGFLPPKFHPVRRVELGLAEGTFYVIAVSRLIRRKSYPDLLRAFQAADLANGELLIIGDGPEEPTLKSLAAELGISERVRFLGPVDEEKKFQYLNAADVFALASMHEGFGIVFQEAMHVGLPIVTTNVGGQTDFLVHGINALLAPPAMPELLGQCLTELRTNASLRREIAANNRRDIDLQSISSVGHQYTKAYEKTMEYHYQQKRSTS